MKRLLSQHIISLCLALLVLGQAFDKGLIWSGFQVNQSYIAAELCENRYVPDSSCEGECQLHKALEKAKEKEAQHTNGEKQAEWIICQQALDLTPKFLIDNSYISYLLARNDAPYLFSLYHKLVKPPEAPQA